MVVLILPASILTLPAYVGPGPGLTLLGAFVAVLLALIGAITAILLWPLRRLRRRRQQQRQEAEARRVAGQGGDQP